MTKMTAQVNFYLFLNVFSVWLAIRRLEIGTFVLIKVLLTYLKVFRTYQKTAKILLIES